MKNQVLYTSRSPVPYCDKFSKKINAKKSWWNICFSMEVFKNFFNTPESNLEKIEACDSNRICDNGVVNMYLISKIYLTFLLILRKI